MLYLPATLCVPSAELGFRHRTPITMSRQPDIKHKRPSRTAAIMHTFISVDEADAWGLELRLAVRA